MTANTKSAPAICQDQPARRDDVAQTPAPRSQHSTVHDQISLMTDHAGIAGVVRIRRVEGESPAWRQLWRELLEGEAGGGG